jgi:hypothetical protein
MTEVRNDVDSLLLRDELEAYDSRLYEIKYPELKARSLIPTLDNSSNLQPSSTHYYYQMMDGVGEAVPVHARSTAVPQADVFATEHSQRIQKYGSDFSFSVDEARAIAAGQMGDIALMRQNTARKAIERKFDEIILLGDSANGLKGAFNHSAVTASNAATGSWTASSTEDDVLADIESAISAISTATSEVYSANLVILPPSAMRALKANRIGNTAVSLLEYVRNTFPEVQFEESNRLETAGASSTKRMVAMHRDPEVLGAIVTQEFTKLDPVWKGRFWEVACEARCGGVVIRQPKALVYRDAL